MLLPNATRAVVSDAKVREYLLSSSHPIGRFKAAFCRSLGFSEDDWEQLRDALLAIASRDEAFPGQPSTFGRKFEIRARKAFKGPRNFAVGDGEGRPSVLGDASAWAPGDEGLLA
ncbi:MAG TPA: hypothetical protein VHC69_09225 [Polyangiaceae bacterium]|nr:hypothetical protein [Polyangiaceae bacterium]